MSLVTQIKRAMGVSPLFALRKIIEAPGRQLDVKRQRTSDYNSTTFSALPVEISAGNMFSYLDMPGVDVLSGYREDILTATKYYTNHYFDLLGSGWVRVSYGLKARGVEDLIFFSDDCPYHNETRLQQKVTKSNLEESVNIYSNIKGNYIPIDWQIDFKSGYCWEGKAWYKDIKYGHIPGADIKVPWETGRMQHLPIFAYASALSQDFNTGYERADVFYNEFRNQVIDFIATNPPRFGVQWMSSMDVAIRAVNWLAAYDLFRSSGALIDTEFEEILKKSIYEHGRHIVSNLEWSSGMRGNHYLANIAGLMFIAAYLPVSEETTQWLAFALQEMSSEIFYQFNEDGSNFEASTYYHSLAAELVLWATLIALMLPEEKISALGNYKPAFFSSNKTLLPIESQSWGTNDKSVVFSKDYAARLAKICRFFSDIVKPGGYLDQVGDNDSGKFLKLIPFFNKFDIESPELIDIDEFPEFSFYEDINNRSDIVTLVNLFTGRKTIESNNLLINILGTEGTGEALFIHEVSKAYDFIADKNEVQAYPDFGLYIYKKELYKATVRCGSIGQKGKGGHAHNDQLSFCLSVKGEDILSDPGTYLYTPLADRRNQFRSVKKHNTLVIDEMEQNQWLNESKDDLFWMMGDRAKAHVIGINEDTFVGSHKGYGAEHKRTIEFGRQEIKGNDTCGAKESKKLHFHLAPFLNPLLTENNEVVISHLNFNVIFKTNTGKFALENYLYSPSYGIVQNAMRIILNFTGNETDWSINVVENF